MFQNSETVSKNQNKWRNVREGLGGWLSGKSTCCLSVRTWVQILRRCVKAGCLFWMSVILTLLQGDGRERQAGEFPGAWRVLGLENGMEKTVERDPVSNEVGVRSNNTAVFWMQHTCTCTHTCAYTQTGTHQHTHTHIYANTSNKDPHTYTCAHTHTLFIVFLARETIRCVRACLPYEGAKCMYFIDREFKNYLFM